jgi:hypothetical protein
VSKGSAQGTRQVKIAAAGFGVDVGGAASAVASVNAKQPFSDPDVAADPIEFFPGPGAVDVEIGAKTQRVDFDAPLFFEAAHRRQIDQRHHIVRLVHEVPVMRAHQRRRAAQGGNQLPDDLLDLGARVFVVEIGDDELVVVLRDRQLQGFDVQDGSDPRQCFFEHQHHEQSLLAPFGLAGVERGAGAHQSKDAIVRERLLGL